LSGSDPSVGSTRRDRSGASSGGSPLGDGDDLNCDFRFQTVLASPNPAAVAQITDGEILDVVKIESPRGVEVRRLSGERVGAVSSHIVELRDCIDRGNSYEAEVLRVAGGSVTVEIRHQ
jgi:hypothetical protein